MALQAELRRMSNDELLGTATVQDGTVVGTGGLTGLENLTVFDQEDKEYEATDGESYLRNLPNAFGNQLFYVILVDNGEAEAIPRSAP